MPPLFCVLITAAARCVIIWTNKVHCFYAWCFSELCRKDWEPEDRVRNLPHSSFFHSAKTAENSRKQLQIVIMGPRKGKKKDDKLSDSESEMQDSSENPRFSKSGTSFSTLKSSGSGKTNPKLLARLIAFAGLLLVTFITRYYSIDLPEHIW